MKTKQILETYRKGQEQEYKSLEKSLSILSSMGYNISANSNDDKVEIQTIYDSFFNYLETLKSDPEMSKNTIARIQSFIVSLQDNNSGTSDGTDQIFI